MHRIYCINLPTSIDRKQRMINRFNYHQLLDKVTFVDGILYTDPILDRYNYGRNNPDINDKVWRCGYACFLAHLKALRTFLDDEDNTDDGALFCEDDIMLVNNFNQAYDEVWKNVPDNDVDLISLSYMLVGWNGCQSVGKIHKESLFTINPPNHFGCQLYYLSRNYAQYCLTTFDKPFKQLDEEGILKTSEVILKHGKGYFTPFKLAVEECIDSDRQPLDVPFHKNHFFHHLRLYDGADKMLVEQLLSNWK